ncbi:hypothetical protein M8J75_006401 [Diaphorina citri]|nr:hypothetical protein M8J75_006401 [Diaphorina citri]
MKSKPKSGSPTSNLIQGGRENQNENVKSSPGSHVAFPGNSREENEERCSCIPVDPGVPYGERESCIKNNENDMESSKMEWLAVASTMD